MALEVVNHPGADGEREHHVEKIPSMFAGKPQHRCDFDFLQKRDDLRMLFRLQAWPEKRQQGADDCDLAGPVGDDPCPLVSDFFEQVHMVQRERLRHRVIKKIVEGDVDFGHVEHQEHHGCTGQWNTEVDPVKTITSE
ncbi:hypothetical protein D3C87_1141520 [compost metagenome]